MATFNGYFGPVTGTPAAPQFAKVAFLGHTVESGGESKAMNVITHWRTPVPLPGSAEYLLGAAIQTAFSAAWVACFTNDYTLDNIGVKFLDNPLNPEVLTADGTTGTITTDRGPSFQAIVLRKLTGVPSRNYRGSMHHGAVPESFTTKDDVNATGQTAYNALKAVWNGILTTGISDGFSTWYPIVLSSTLSSLLSNPAIFWGAWQNDTSLNLKVGTMKRRKEKGGAA